MLRPIYKTCVISGRTSSGNAKTQKRGPRLPGAKADCRRKLRRRLERRWRETDRGRRWKDWLRRKRDGEGHRKSRSWLHRQRLRMNCKRRRARRTSATEVTAAVKEDLPGTCTWLMTDFSKLDSQKNSVISREKEILFSAGWFTGRVLRGLICKRFYCGLKIFLFTNVLNSQRM